MAILTQYELMGDVQKCRDAVFLVVTYQCHIMSLQLNVYSRRSYLFSLPFFALTKAVNHGMLLALTRPCFSLVLLIVLHRQVKINMLHCVYYVNSIGD